MIWRQPTPEAIEHFQNSGGELEYSFFLVDEESRNAHLRAIDAHLADADGSFGDPDAWHLSADRVAYLKTLAPRELSEEQFFGDWCDPRDRMLVKCGEGEVKGRGRIQNPRYDTIYGCKSGVWPSGTPRLNEAGQYAYAFSQPPYNLSLTLEEVQKSFRDINELILPEGAETVIRDWSGRNLVPLDPYFEAGAEWWGTFLFTLYRASESTLIVISGSSTD